MSDGTLDGAWPAAGRPFGVKGFGARALAVSDNAGGVIVLWSLLTEPEGRMQHILANGNVAPAWPVEGLVYGSNSPYRAPVEDGAGGVISSWLLMPDSEGNAYFVYGQHILDEGMPDPQWPQTLYIANTDSDSPADPRAVSDGAGGAIVAYEGYDFIAMIRVLSSGQVDPAWPANGLRLGTLASAIPALVPDGGDAVIAAWTEYRSGNNYDILAQRVSLSGSTAGVPPLPTSAVAMLRVTPTPTREMCTIDFTMPVAGRAAITIHDVEGRKVAEVLRGEVGAGPQRVTWRGRVDGRRVPNGVYFIRLESDRGARVQRLVLAR